MGFWIAIAAGALNLIEITTAPVVSLIDAGLFFAVAWGIRRGRWWAAVVGAYMILFPFLVTFLRQERPLLQVATVGAVCLTAAFFMLRTAAKVRAASNRQGIEWPWVTVTGLIVAATLVLRPMMLPTGSMENTLKAGDHFFFESVSHRLGGGLSRGDLVVFRYPPDRRQTFVKRIVGIPGDRLRIQDKILYRNGVAVQEPYAQHKTGYVDSFRDNFPSAPNVTVAANAGEMLSRHVRDGEVIVPPGHYFVLGDNRDNSLDSRYWGFVAREDVMGRPLLLYGSKTKMRAWPKLLTRA